MLNPRASTVKTLDKPAQRPTPIYLNGRPVGRVVGGVFQKTVHASRHFLRTPRAIAFDRSTLRDAQAAGAVRVEVTDAETGDRYAAELATVWAYAFPVRRGFGDQVGVPLDRWSINGETPAAERRAAETNRERCELQLGLFEVTR